MKDIRNLNEIHDKQFIFGSLFTVSNKLQTLLDRALKEFDMTAKQLYLAIALANLFDRPPTLKEASAAIGYTHQNIKQIALKLELKGFLKLEKDEDDARVLRLILTEKINEFWNESDESGSIFLTSIFDGIDESEVQLFRKTIGSILINIYKMENSHLL